MVTLCITRGLVGRGFSRGGGQEGEEKLTVTATHVSFPRECRSSVQDAPVVEY